MTRPGTRTSAKITWKNWQTNPEWPPFVEHLQELLQKGDVLFLYGAKDEEHNQAVVLKEAAEEALAKLP